MEHTSETLATATPANKIPALRTWVKPEAKAAEVAKATLAGSNGPTQPDNVNCGS